VDKAQAHSESKKKGVLSTSGAYETLVSIVTLSRVT